MKVTLVGRTEFVQPEHVPWRPDETAGGGEALAELAGRACYQSWTKPNPKTATNAGYLEHIREVQHFSVLEHGTASFYIEGVSRSLTHELVRHRHFSYSQLSQRYVSGAEFVAPPAIADDPELLDLFNEATSWSRIHYEALLYQLDQKFEHLPAGTGKKKQARQAARAVLPNATETKIIVTGNYRAWRHFVELRASEAADVEIRALAVEIARQLQVVAPNVFGDLEFVTLDDGTEVIG